MRPDRYGRRSERGPSKVRPPRGEEVTRLDGSLEDPELVGIADELSRAGIAARGVAGGAGWGPSPAFAADLRARLLDGFSQSPAGETTLLALRTTPGSQPTIQLAERTQPSGQRTMPVTQPLLPRIARRSPTLLPAPRWTALGAAAALLLSVIGFNASLLRPVDPTAVAGVASGATLVRDGERSTLVAGTLLQVGDEVRVAESGRATIVIGSSEARLAGGADLRIDVVSADRIILDQIDGRVFHRVVTDPGTTYTVETAGLDWIARGTAFDVHREAAERGERVTLTAVQHDVRLSGPALEATIEEGRQAVVQLGGDEPDIATGDVSEIALHDPWFVANARIDLALGRPLGILDRLNLAEASPATPPTVRPSDASFWPVPSVSSSPIAAVGPSATPPATSATPKPTARPTPRPTPKPSPRPTPKPTAKPTPKPTPQPTPALGALSLAATACPGGVVLDWGAFGGDGFAHYLVLRSTSSTIPAAYPAEGSAWGVDETYTTEVGATDGYDPIDAGGETAHYRAIAFGEGDQALAASAVRTVTTKAMKSLGALTSGPDGAATAFGWSPLDGPAGCYSYYKLAYSADDPTPSYLEGSPIAWAGSDQAASSVSVDALDPGTYWFRLQAIRATSLGKFVVAQTTVVQYTVP
jgi:outer membrane biosynthesis protein TonB